MTRLALACVLVTWGFSLFVYGHWQRVSGFESRTECETQRAMMGMRLPVVAVDPACTEDRD